MRTAPFFVVVVAAAVAALGALSTTARADQVTSCSDAFDQSQARRDEGKLLEARRLLRVCGGPTCSPTQQRLCSEWATDVEARVPSFVLAAKGPSGTDLVDVSVLMDGALVATTLGGRAIDVDPGQHAFVFTLADGTKAETTAVAAERTKGKIVSVSLGQGALGSTTAPAAPSPAGASSGGGWSTMKTAGLVAGGVGVVGLVLGTAFGVEALSTKSSDCSNGICDPGTSSKAYSQATISTIGFIAGGVLVAGGVTLFVLAPKGAKDQPAASVSVSPVLGWSAGGLQLLGRW